MIKLPYVLSFTAMTAFFWGIYGLVLREGTELLDHNSLLAFIGVGLAYFLIAILVPVALLNRKREVGYWSMSGTVISILAGAVGALGALGVTLALALKGQAIYVMPIVFGGAPVVNTLLTSWLNKSFRNIRPLFIVGMILVACGMVGVLTTKPPSKLTTEGVTNVYYVAGSIALAVVCWGAYGPFLHLGQTRMGGSRLRPFCCVGISYFFIAVAVPFVILLGTNSFPVSQDLGWETIAKGMFWSVMAGCAGALGALGIIMAFTYGGKPIFVMPLVFGFAPVINTIIGLFIQNKLTNVSQYFIGSIALGIAGAITVLMTAPKAKPHGGPTPSVAPPSTPPTSSASTTSTSPALPSTGSLSVSSSAPSSAGLERNPYSGNEIAGVSDPIIS